jgi:hypothetical protein
VNGRHVAAQGRVRNFVKAWRALYPQRPKVTNGFGIYDLTVVDLETILTPRVVVRTIPQLQALAIGTVIMTAANRAAQVEGYEDCDEHGELIVVKRLIYVGTDLDDYLTPSRMHHDTRDTLRRMLPAIVIHPLD